MEKYEGIIEILASNDYYKAKRLIKILNDFDSFIGTMVKISNPYVFDRFCKMVEYKMDTDLYYQTRNTYIKKMLMNQKNAKVLDYFDNINPNNYNNYLLCENELSTLNNDFLMLESISNRWLNEYIIGYFFGDNYYNFLANLFQMVNYLSRTKKTLINRNHIDLYNEFRELNTKSFADKIAFFKEHMNNNYKDIFYDDMRKVKDSSYQELIDASIKLNHQSPIYCKEISKNNDIDIYYLNGEDFYAFVRVFSISREDLSDQSDYIFANDNYLGHSFSYISSKDIGTIDYEQKKVILLYDDIDFNNIMYVHHSDLHSKKMTMQDSYLSEKENEIVTPNSLMAYTKNYNEIYIVGKNKPKALICYNEITKDDIAFAKKYNLSIVLLNTKKYKRFESYDDEYNDNSYVI